MRRRHAHATGTRTYDAKPSNTISWLQDWFEIFVGVDEVKVLEDFFTVIVECLDGHLHARRWKGPISGQFRRVVEGIAIEKISLKEFRAS